MKMKKCPPGVICIESVTLFFVFVSLFLLFGFFFYQNTRKIIVNNNNTQEEQQERGGFFRFLPSWPYTNLPSNDVLLNPYVSPLRDERYFVPELTSYAPPNSIPINISTSAVDTTYRQMGILQPLNGVTKDNILPLMGRPLFTSRSKWQYYTISNQHNNVKLPISFKGHSGLSDYGVDEIFNADTVYVEGYEMPFKVTLYENNVIKYLPFV